MPTPALVTPSQLAAYTQGKVLATDPRVAGLLDGATAAVRRYCGWHIAPSITQTLTLDGPGGPVLTLPTMHLTAVASVTEDSTALAIYDHLEHTGDYEWSELGSVRRRGALWTETYRGVVAEITHGFDDAPDLAQIIMQVVSAALASPMGATRESAGSFSVSWASTAPGVAGGLSLLERDLAVLSTYRLRDA